MTSSQEIQSMFPWDECTSRQHYRRGQAQDLLKCWKSWSHIAFIPFLASTQIPTLCLEQMTTFGSLFYFWKLEWRYWKLGKCTQSLLFHQANTCRFCLDTALGQGTPRWQETAARDMCSVWHRWRCFLYHSHGGTSSDNQNITALKPSSRTEQTSWPTSFISVTSKIKHKI